MERNGSVPSSTLLLDRVGDVVLTINSDGLSWKSLNSDSSTSFCLDMMLHLKTTSEIKFSDVYAIEFIDWGLIHNVVWNAGGFLSSKKSEMYRFVVHGVHRSKTGHSPWVLSAYTFGHKDLQTCQTWVEQINACINKEVGRPKSLLVFVHPLCGKGKGLEIWETVAPIFVRAKVKTMVNITQRAGHAYDVITSCTDRELSSFDGIVTVGGDGLFNEVLNGLLSSRHKVPYPPTPVGFNSARSNVQLQPKNSSSGNGRASFDDRSGTVSETSYGIDEHEPLLATSEPSGLGISKFKAAENGSQTTDQDIVLSFPNDWFRLGIIPAGSTDAIVISTTGVRDPVTSALHIILGKKVPLDIAQVVRWKTSPSSIDVPSVRYAASFAGYGFYGDVIKESEKYRWMGPKRYDFAGTKVFLEHRSYEAEVAFLAANTVQPVTVTDTSGSGTRSSLLSRKKVVCRMNCSICKGTTNSCILANRSISDHGIHVEGFKWLRSKGHFLSVGAAVISCRNERAPEGLVADAHLSDGFLHLILVKDCPRPLYLWHLTQLTRRGTDPLNFKFVEHHKTPAFTFVSNHDESAWNLDGEIFRACQVSVQACQGLINLFASGPEV